MEIPIILIICVLLILAYLFDITAAKTKIPSVILLLVLGWVVRQISIYLGLHIPDLNSILPVLGTIGLILIVLEGSLELEINSSKLKLIRKTSLIAIIPMVLLSIGLAITYQYFEPTSFKNALTNAIPFAIISSAIAIPSAQNLGSKIKEFVTYESSLSDIFGVILFNFITLNEVINSSSVGHFFRDLAIILAITFIATIGLAFLLSKIKHHVKYAPIIIIVVLIYEISKIYHLPALIFILLFGIFLSNLDELKHLKFIKKLKPEILNKEVHKFKELTTEIAFLIRALFFLLFGYLIETKDLLNGNTIIWSLGITASILILRYIILKLFKQSVTPLIFLAPRGLITILLFLSIPATQSMLLVNKSIIIQVIILNALVMMFGFMFYDSKKHVVSDEPDFVVPYASGEKNTDAENEKFI